MILTFSFADDYGYNDDSHWDNNWDHQPQQPQPQQQQQSWDRWGHHPSGMQSPHYYDPYYPSG